MNTNIDDLIAVYNALVDEHNALHSLLEDPAHAAEPSTVYQNVLEYHQVAQAQIVNFLSKHNLSHFRPDRNLS